ncbi:hypothetical protein A8709_30240 [Paenibacillus pectinilyticus]|uniref:Uncharacterized protein n=1 Tax=Paenibacillus pectinilyticus TaxID=512399 RepID=A0A1C0ZVJ8_9BACL|nr:hypothetical protein [Paenibacillus pectinilyticus]OCT12134.1 hypothetical protein A8709_30240 [Paenibacillus pectinilyticus]
MWKLMLQTEQFDVHMDEANLLLEIRILTGDHVAPVTVRMCHADLTQLLHTLLEINRSFRGDIAFFLAKKLTDKP